MTTVSNVTRSSRTAAAMALGTPALLVALLSGCAATGPNTGNARAVLYPNAAHKQMGEDRARGEVDNCAAMALRAGLSANEQNNDATRRAGQAAAVAGVAAAVGALVSGGNSGSAVRAGAGGAAVAGSAVAVSGAFDKNRGDATYRQFVQRCASEKGLEVIGWN